MTTKKRIEALKYFAGAMTALVALVVFAALMLVYTRKDVLEILVLYGMFVYLPAFGIPFIIAGEDPDDDYEDGDDY